VDRTFSPLSLYYAAVLAFPPDSSYVPLRTEVVTALDPFTKHSERAGDLVWQDPSVLLWAFVTFPNLFFAVHLRRQQESFFFSPFFPPAPAPRLPPQIHAADNPGFGVAPFPDYSPSPNFFPYPPLPKSCKVTNNNRRVILNNPFPTPLSKPLPRLHWYQFLSRCIFASLFHPLCPFFPPPAKPNPRLL